MAEISTQIADGWLPRGVELFGDVKVQRFGTIGESKPPKISGMTPAPGTGLEAIQSLSFDVVDEDGDLGRVLIAIQYENYGRSTEMIWDGDKVIGPHQVSYIPITNGHRYTILRNGGWAGPFVLRVFATDLAGNEI